MSVVVAWQPQTALSPGSTVGAAFLGSLSEEQLSEKGCAHAAQSPDVKIHLHVLSSQERVATIRVQGLGFRV